MQNTTATNDDAAVAVVAIVSFGALVYVTLILLVWSHARRALPLYALVLALLLPPLFPFLLLYLVFFTFDPFYLYAPRTIVVQTTAPSSVGRTKHVPQRAGGTHV